MFPMSILWWWALCCALCAVSVANYSSESYEYSKKVTKKKKRNAQLNKNINQNTTAQYESKKVVSEYPRPRSQKSNNVYRWQWKWKKKYQQWACTNSAIHERPSFQIKHMKQSMSSTLASIKSPKKTLPGQMKLKCESIEEQNPSEIYQPTPKCRGVCLIIDNWQLSDETQLGDHESALIDLFASYRYNVERYRNITANKIRQIFTNVASMDHSEADSFICIIRSHGAVNQVRGSDAHAIDFKQILAAMSSDQCTTLQNKPKIFILQSCENCDFQRLNGEVEAEEKGVVYPSESEFFISYAEIHGCAAGNGVESSQIFMKYFVECLTNYGQTSIDKAIKFVRRRIQENGEEGSHERVISVSTLCTRFNF